MKIAVLCGGISRERDVSISTGTCVARALRERGHKVAMVDLFLGDPQGAADPESAFSTNDEINIKKESSTTLRVLTKCYWIIDFNRSKWRYESEI